MEKKNIEFIKTEKQHTSSRNYQSQFFKLKIWKQIQAAKSANSAGGSSIHFKKQTFQLPYMSIKAWDVFTEGKIQIRFDDGGISKLKNHTDGGIQNVTVKLLVTLETWYPTANIWLIKYIIQNHKRIISRARVCAERPPNIADTRECKQLWGWVLYELSAKVPSCHSDINRMAFVVINKITSLNHGLVICFFKSTLKKSVGSTS